MTLSFAPLQFDIAGAWNSEKDALLSSQDFRLALDRLRDLWIEVSRERFESHSQTDLEQAQAEYELNVHTAEVMVFNFWWLKEQFEPDDLAYLSEAIATTLYPEKKWEVIENCDYMVVSDSERRMVLDFKNGREISASASLILAGDTKIPLSEKAVAEVEKWETARLDARIRLLDRMQSDLAEFRKEGQVIPLTPET
jgi:hypothetical protein